MSKILKQIGVKIFGHSRFWALYCLIGGIPNFPDFYRKRRSEGCHRISIMKRFYNVTYTCVKKTYDEQKVELEKIIKSRRASEQ